MTQLERSRPTGDGVSNDFLTQTAGRDLVLESGNV